MTQQQTTQPHYFVDAIGFSHLAPKLPLGIKQQKAHRRQIAQRIAANRIVQHHASRDGTKDGSTAFYRRQDLFGNNNSYKSCICLDSHGTVAVACDSMGRLDVVRLPKYDDGDKQNSVKGRPMGTLLAGKMSIRQIENMEGSFHLKSMDRGNLLCVGMPNGEFGMFATEHAVDVGHRYGLSENTARIYQEPKGPTFINTSWSIPLPRQNRSYHHRSPGSVSSLPFQSHNNLGFDSFSNPQEDWEGNAERKRFSYDNIYRWAFLETASAILAVHVDDTDLHGVALHVRDSRLRHAPRKSSIHIDLMPHFRGSAASQEEVSCVGWMSENVLLTSQIQEAGLGNSLKLWDVRMSGILADHVIDSFLFDSSHGAETKQRKVSDTKRRSRILRVMPSYGAGTALVTVKQVVDSTIHYDHQLIDVGTWQLLQRIQSPHTFAETSEEDYGIPSYTSAPEQTLVDAATPHLDCFATFESPCISFHSLSPPTATGTTTNTIATEKARGKKRRSDCEEIVNDQSTQRKFTPKLIDGDTLPTRLSCMAFNEGGTVLIGGSRDGDLFVWRSG